VTARAPHAADGAGAPEGLLLDQDRRRLEDELVARFCPPLPPHVVRDCVDASLARYAHAPVRAYLRILVERAAVARLRVLALAGPDDPEALVDLAAAESRRLPEQAPVGDPDPVRDAPRCVRHRGDDLGGDAATAGIRPRQRETAP
jgi:hypothetical protein